MKHTILCVDDEVDNLDALERIFRKDYKVLKAASGKEALEFLKNDSQHTISLIISDQRMPQMSGVEFLRDSQLTHSDCIRILLTGYTDINSVIDAINSGHIYRYITKPWDVVDLQNAVQKSLEAYDLKNELKIKNEQLQKAYDELKTLDQAKSDFMLLINHELKTPLTSLISFSDLLKETKLDADQSKYLSRISTSALRLQSLIQDALEYVSAESGLTQMRFQKFKSMQIKNLIPAACIELTEKKNLKVDFAIDACELWTDEKYFTQVIQRLLHNACKFANPNSQVQIIGKMYDSQKFEIQIKNQAPHISPNDIQKILKAFSLNENALHHSTGTGMGLSISRALLKLLYSNLEMHSKGDEVLVQFTVPISK